MRNTVLYGDALEKLRTIPDGIVQCCVTSPPYWGLRDYGESGQLGLEETPQEYVAKLVEIFREVHRVLRPDGTVWFNLGDSYASDIKGTGGPTPKQQTNAGSFYQMGRKLKHGLKAKDLVGIPWRVAFALQDDGWWLRNDIIWHKPNVMPTSVRDRLTMCHEYIFLLTKSSRYFYDQDAIREPHKEESIARYEYGLHMKLDPNAIKGGVYDRTLAGVGDSDRMGDFVNPEGRNKRTVWTMNSSAYKGAHFATFPEELPETCIKAGTSEKGACPHCGAPWQRAEPQGWEPTCECPDQDPLARCLVLDPFSGTGTTLATATALNQDFLGIELNPKYKPLIDERLTPEVEKRGQRETFNLMDELDGVEDES